MPLPEGKTAAPILIVPHHHPTCVARLARGRFSGNVCAVLENGPARLIRVRKRGGVDVDHHLIALAWRVGIEAVMQRRLR